MPTLERLEAEGLIELTLIQGVPSGQMPAAFARADVVLDQFRAGSYGVAACEAMAAGCIVVGQVTSQVRDAVRERTGRDLPIIDATPTTLEAVLRELAADPDLDSRRASMIEFVHSVHDGRLAAEVLIDGWVRPAAPDDRKEPSRASSS
jgi:hypothetical protein